MALLLQLLDLATGLNVVVVDEGHWSLSVLVGDLLGLGVNLLLSLTLTTFEIHEGNNVALGLEASLINGALVKEDGCVENKTIN